MENELLIDSGIIKDIPVNKDVLRNYINQGEKIIGFGVGGSESLTVFLNKPGCTTKVVRKILSENLITAKWDGNGKDVMLAPYNKAKQQAFYLQNLPEHVKQFFPRVENIIERVVPKITTGSFEKNDTENELVNELIYDMSYISGDEVSEFIRKNKPPVWKANHYYIY